MGDVGALSAYLDREGVSRGIIYLTYGTALLLYYVIYIGCSHIWTMMCFGSNNYSGEVN